VIDLSCEPELGPVEPHVHPTKVDSFYILDGEVEFTLGDETIRAGADFYVAAPPGARHGFRPVGRNRARILNIHAPSDGFIERVRSDARQGT
jgi:mannose-6-phosphate isomerase-like protein (cupin superfamily)